MAVEFQYFYIIILIRFVRNLYIWLQSLIRKITKFCTKLWKQVLL